MIDILAGDTLPATLSAVARIHREELAQGFLSSLGDRALTMLFAHAATAPSGVLLVARDRDTGRIAGFLLGTTDTGSFYKEFLRRRALRAAIVLLPRLLSVKRIVKVLETLFYPARRNVRELPGAELLDIAVDSSFQGQGLGRRFFAEFVRVMASRGIRRFRITTGKSLTGAQAFYEKLGAQKVGTMEVHQGAETIVYVYSLPRSAS